MTQPLRFESATDLWHLPRFLSTFWSILAHPMAFFSNYYDLVTHRSPDLFDINTQSRNDRYLGPVKFSALAIGLNNLLLPVTMELGVLVGAVSRDYYNFYERAKAGGWLSAPDWTGIGVLDGFLMDLIRLLTFYLLGVLIWLFSRRAISVRFTTGYFFYINAWSLLGSLFTVFFILTGFVMPWYQTGLPALVSLGVQLAFTFMILIFPIALWPKLLEVKRSQVAIALGLSLVTWAIMLAVVAPMIISMPEF